MSGARALVAAVPQRVWTAVAGLVLLASVGVALVLGAGLSTWQGAVTHPPSPGAERHPETVVSPPDSAVIVVPSPPGPAAHVPLATGAAPPVVPVGVTAPVTSPAPVPATVPTPAASAPAVAPPVGAGTTASPRTASSSALPHTGPGRAVGRLKHTAPAQTAKVSRVSHGNHGKHLGWTKGVRAGTVHGHGHGHGRAHSS